jgi:hypothetical protein
MLISPAATLPVVTTGDAATSHWAGSDAQREQRNCADADDQNDKRDRVIVEPMSALYTHDDLTLKLAKPFFSGLAPGDGFRL